MRRTCKAARRPPICATTAIEAELMAGRAARTAKERPPEAPAFWRALAMHRKHRSRADFGLSMSAKHKASSAISCNIMKMHNVYDTTKARIVVRETTARGTEACSQNCRGIETAIADARPQIPPSKAICARTPWREHRCQERSDPKPQQQRWCNFIKVLCQGLLKALLYCLKTTSMRHRTSIWLRGSCFVRHCSLTWNNQTSCHAQQRGCNCSGKSNMQT